MNVISIGTDRNLFTAGSAVQKRQIEYAELFDEVHIIVFSLRAHELPEKISIAPRVWVYATQSTSRFSYGADAARIGADIIRSQRLSPQNTVVTTQDPFETAVAGYALKQSFHMPLHIQIHTDFLSPYFVSTGRLRDRILNRARVFMAKKYLRHADAVRVVSERIARSLQAKHMLSAHCTLENLPIFVERPHAVVASEHASLREKYPDFKFIMLMASRFTTEKNIPLGITVFSRLLKKYPHHGLGLVIVGDGPEKSRIQKQIARLGLAGQVVCESWQHDMPSYYKTADMFLSTSWYEGYGLSMVEAAAAQCCVVATDAGIAPFLTRACPPGNAQCLCDTAAQLISSPHLREKYIREASQWLEQQVIVDKKAYLDRYQASIAAALHA